MAMPKLDVPTAPGDEKNSSTLQRSLDTP
jgi:hypothetical protein